MWNWSDPGGFWQDYAGHEVVVIDNLEPRDMPREFSYSLLLRLCDSYDMSVNLKGSSCPFLARRIYITSVHFPSAWFPERGDYDELNNRITCLRVYTTPHPLADVSRFGIDDPRPAPPEPAVEEKKVAIGVQGSSEPAEPRHSLSSPVRDTRFRTTGGKEESTEQEEEEEGEKEDESSDVDSVESLEDVFFGRRQYDGHGRLTGSSRDRTLPPSEISSWVSRGRPAVSSVRIIID